MTENTRKRPALARIHELAVQHGIEAERLPIDDWADKVTELSGDEVVPDPVEDLVVTMERKGIITAHEGTTLYGNYLAECQLSKVASAEEIQPGQRKPVRDHLAKTLAMAKEAGSIAPGDHKKETDEMWGEEG